MDISDEEILKLWKLLQKHGTSYIMVGGFASNLHGCNRFTSDIDIWIKDSLPNRKSLRLVLKDLDLGDLKEIETTQFVPGFTSINLNSGLELDIMTFIEGFDQSKFDECYAIADVAEIEKIPIRFLNINQLIAAKKASGRPKDLLDLEELEKIKKLK